MRRTFLYAAAGLMATVSLATAQKPGGGGIQPPVRPPAGGAGVAPGAGGIKPSAAGQAPATGGAQTPASPPVIGPGGHPPLSGNNGPGGPPPPFTANGVPQKSVGNNGPGGPPPPFTADGVPQKSAGANQTAGAKFNQGQIVKVDPQTGMLTMRTGTGTSAREQQFRVGNDTRFFGPDRRMLTNGLRFDGFASGSNVWFRSGTGNTANSINDMRLFDPSSPLMSGQIMRGQIVSFDPKTSTVAVRTGTGTDARDRSFRVGNDTRFFGPDLMPMSDGLGSSGFRNGVPVWFAPGAGELSGTLSGLSLGDPSVALAQEGPAGAAPAGGGSPAATGNFMRAVIVMSNAESGAVSLRLGDGPNEREANLKITADTRYFGADRKSVSGGLAFRGFRQGADVWFMTQTGDLTGNITQLSLAEPNTAAEPRPMSPGAGAGAGGTTDADRGPIPSKFVTGSVVALDPESRTITVKTGSGDDAREQLLKVVADTEFFGPQRQPIQEGLKSEMLRVGAPVWMRVGTGELANTVRDLRLYDPSKPPDAGSDKPKGDNDKPKSGQDR